MRKLEIKLKNSNGKPVLHTEGDPDEVLGYAVAKLNLENDVSKVVENIKKSGL